MLWQCIGRASRVESGCVRSRRKVKCVFLPQPTHQPPATTPVFNMVTYCHHAYRHCHSKLLDLSVITACATKHCVRHARNSGGSAMSATRIANRRPLHHSPWFHMNRMVIGVPKMIAISMKKRVCLLQSGWSIRGQAAIVATFRHWCCLLLHSSTRLSIPDTHVRALTVPPHCQQLQIDQTQIPAEGRCFNGMIVGRWQGGISEGSMRRWSGRRRMRLGRGGGREREECPVGPKVRPRSSAAWPWPGRSDAWENMELGHCSISSG